LAGNLPQYWQFHFNVCGTGRQDAAANAKDVSMARSSPNILTPERNFTHTVTLKNIIINNDNTSSSESKSCQCNEMEGSGSTTRKVPTCVSVVTHGTATAGAKCYVKETDT
jgi:hypothetical protein